jgi:hypothetical protein
MLSLTSNRTVSPSRNSAVFSLVEKGGGELSRLPAEMMLRGTASEVWECRKCGRFGSVGVSDVWECPKCGIFASVGVSQVVSEFWRFQKFVSFRSVGFLEVWEFQKYGCPVSEVLHPPQNPLASNPSTLRLTLTSHPSP